ncbi:galactoside 2-alpha-L-fucosyltransferase, partial [Elaeis guineensis]|uniref:galactoside 2-alpha-L-fucosyltransferase n=1 Tax=Elaeis guineensis var. tenera TaxID=51953 RepID=UPI003C6CFE4B
MRIVVKPSRSQQPSTSFLNSGVPEKRLLKGTLGLGFILMVFLVVIPLVVIILGGHQSPLPIWLREVGVWARGGLEDNFVTSKGPKDKLLGGLLPAGFHEESCLSRYQSASYRKASSHLLSHYLLRRLRKYEALHRRCGPNTALYNKTLEQLKKRCNNETAECNYVLWIPFSGLGNRMLTLASAFLYTLLTNRVLLIHTDASMNDLFCEPFPHTSWLVPSDFPMKGFPKFSSNSPRCYGKMLRRKASANNSDDVVKQRLPAYAYLHLFHDYDDFDMHFFCEDDQKFLQNIPWLVIGSDNYFAPSLFSIPSYEEELSRLFPKRDTVFHHLGRYLFHPTNTVWGMITRFYQAYLAKAKERVGIQIRIFNRGSPFMNILDQILACSLREN